MSGTWLERYIAAWARHTRIADLDSGKSDLDAMLAFMDPEIRYEDMPTSTVFVGHDGVAKMSLKCVSMVERLDDAS